MSKGKINNLIQKYNLCAHPEGGYYKEFYRSEMQVISPVHSRKRAAVTHIYFLLVKGQFSRFHRVEHDEIWHFYEGDPLKLFLFDTNDVTEIEIGGRTCEYTAVVPAGVYQAAVSTGTYSLVGCSVSPGFDFEDFSFLQENQHDKEMLLKNYPDYTCYL